MERKISVIIPVYNTEAYLKQCVDSVISQSYKNLEIILVNDGSTDKSEEICNQYHVLDERVILINQKNHGLSYARNQGIRKAAGEYLFFLDSDDFWTDTELVEKLVSRVLERQTDVVNFRYRQYFEDTKQYVDCLTSYEEDAKNQKKEDLVDHLLSKGLYIASACNKMVRTAFLKSRQLYFREGITSEDIDWCARILLACESMDYCNMDAYVYRQRSGSITHTLQYKNVKQLSENIRYCMELGQDLKENDRLYELYFTYVAYQYGVFLLSNHYSNDRRTAKLRGEMKKYRWVLKFNRNAKIKWLYWLDKCIGYAGMNLVMAVYAKIR